MGIKTCYDAQLCMTELAVDLVTSRACAHLGLLQTAATPSAINYLLVREVQEYCVGGWGGGGM